MLTENRDPEDTKWHYYLEEAEQEPKVQAQLDEIRKEYAALTPDQLESDRPMLWFRSYPCVYVRCIDEDL